MYSERFRSVTVKNFVNVRFRIITRGPEAVLGPRFDKQIHRRNSTVRGTASLCICVCATDPEPSSFSNKLYDDLRQNVVIKHEFDRYRAVRSVTTGVLAYRWVE